MTAHTLLRLAVAAFVALEIAAGTTAGDSLDMCYGWTNTAGGSGKDQPDGVTTDSEGNILVLGSYYESIDFDPSDGEDFQPHGSPGDSNMFLTRYGADGSYHWTRVWTWNTYCNPFDITLDPAGNIVLTGGFWATQDFDPGPGEDWHTAGAPDEYLNADIFVIKLTPDGAFLWARTMGSDEFCHGLGLAVDSQGSIFVAGQFEGLADFDPAAGSSDLHQSDWQDAFLTKFTPTGDYVWTYTMGGPDYDYCAHVALDSEENIYVTGSAGTGTDFDPTAGEDFQPVQGRDAYLTRIEADGTYGWTRTFGGPDGAHQNGESGRKLAIDADDNVVVAGRYASPDTDFDPGPSVDHHPLRGGLFDLFVSKYASDGSYCWTRTIGGTERDEARAVTVDSANNIFVGGDVGERFPQGQGELIDVDPTDGEDWQMLIGGDIFLVKLKTDGSYGWGLVWGSEYSDRIKAITVDEEDNLIYGGQFWNAGPVDFDPTDGVDLRWAHGYTDFSATKLLSLCRGDLNCDGAINGFDIDPFLMVLLSTDPYDDYYEQYPDCDHLLGDCNNDGVIDGFDIEPFVELLLAG